MNKKVITIMPVHRVLLDTIDRAGGKLCVDDVRLWPFQVSGRLDECIGLGFLDEGVTYGEVHLTQRGREFHQSDAA